MGVTNDVNGDENKIKSRSLDVCPIQTFYACHVSVMFEVRLSVGKEGGYFQKIIKFKGMFNEHFHISAISVTISASRG